MPDAAPLELLPTALVSGTDVCVPALVEALQPLHGGGEVEVLRHVAADEVRPVSHHELDGTCLAQRLDKRLANPGVGDQLVAVLGVRVPALEARRIREQQVGELGLLTVVDVDADVVRDQLLVEQHLPRQIRFGVAVGCAVGEAHVEIHLRAAFLDVLLDQLADAHRVPVPGQRILTRRVELARVLLAPHGRELAHPLLDGPGQLAELWRAFEERFGRGRFGARKRDPGEAILAVLTTPHAQCAQAEAAGPADVANQHVEESDAPVGLHAVVVLGRPPIGHGRAVRRCPGKLARDATDVPGRDPTLLLGPLGGVLLPLHDVLLHVFQRDVDPALPEPGVVEPLFEDHVRHRIGHAAVRAGYDGVVLVGDGGCDAGPDLEGDHPGTVVHTRVLDATHQEHAALIGLHRVGPEVDDVLRVGDVLGLPLEVAAVEAHQRGAAIR